MLQYRIAVLGCPVVPDVPWTLQNLHKCKELGFNAMQLNIAWGSRPGDEPLNIEDLVALAPEVAEQYPQTVPLRSLPERHEQRRATLRHRISLCRQMNLRTIFHFGAPYNAHCAYGDNPPNCLCDERVIRRHELLIDTFAADFPGVDDLLLYTYDQDAWLCSEFGTCPRCKGVPLHRRIGGFVNRLARQWRKHNAAGRLWWEPWELSAGQVLASLPDLDASCVGLMLHNNVAECMVTLPVDRFVRNAVRSAKSLGLPTILEGFLGAATEEVEPYTHLQTPLTTFRQVRTMASVPDVAGVKEYYGLIPDREDPNLRAAAMAMSDSELSEQEVLELLAQPYGDQPVQMKLRSYWQSTSSAMELFPWDVSWYVREIGRCNPQHTLTAAFLRGQQCHTPSWESTRKAIFMKTDNQECDPWLREDIQLRCELAAQKMQQALAIGREAVTLLTGDLRDSFARGIDELGEFRRGALSYALHLRETNLVSMLREAQRHGQDLPEHILKELIDVLRQDQHNMQSEAPIGPAIRMLQQDLPKFLDHYFHVPERNSEPLGYFSLTSR